MFRFNPAIVLFIGFELCYYLLIAQTGIVEVFHSDIRLIAFLPIGGVLGTYLSSHIKLKENYKVGILLSSQALLTLLYPDFNFLALFLLGLAVGGMAPLIVNSVKKANNIDLLFSLCIAYAAGTFLFNTDPLQRGTLGVVLSVIPLISYFFIDMIKIENIKKQQDSYLSYTLPIMTFWVFLDSTLFETLSRDIHMSIWRDGYTTEIMVFHIIGVIAGVFLKLNHFQKSLTTLILFSLSYLAYFLREPLVLSILYPIVISYYNVLILQSMSKIKSLKTIGIYMVFIGWIASGAGLFVALEGFILYVPLLFMVAFLYMINQQNYISNNKEAYNG